MLKPPGHRQEPEIQRRFKWLHANAVLQCEFAESTILPTVRRLGSADGPPPTEAGLTLRMIAWLQTVKALDHPRHLQAMATAARALLELAVDLELLANDPSSETEIRLWEESAKLKHAECAARYVRRGANDQRLDELLGIWDNAVSEKGADIRKRREAAWGNERRHPDRWTGRSLLDDCREVDRILGLTEDERFEETYELNVRPLHWQVHGSGLAQYRDPSPMAVLNVAAMSLALVNRLGDRAIRAAFKALGQPFDQVAFEQMAEKSNAAHDALGFGGTKRTASGNEPVNENTGASASSQFGIDRTVFLLNYVSHLRNDISMSEERKVKTRINQDQQLRWVATVAGGALGIMLSYFPTLALLVGEAYLVWTLVLLGLATLSASVTLGLSMGQLFFAEQVTTDCLSYYGSILAKQELLASTMPPILIPTDEIPSITRWVDDGLAKRALQDGRYRWARKLQLSYRIAFAATLLFFGIALLPALVGLVMK